MSNGELEARKFWFWFVDCWQQTIYWISDQLPIVSWQYGYVVNGTNVNIIWLYTEP